MIKAILFDVDNTLMDFRDMKRKAVKAVVHSLKDNGLNMSYDEAFEKLMDLYWEVGIESENWIGEFLRKYDKEDDIKIAAAINAYKRTKATYLKTYPQVHNVLIKLIKKGIKLAVISDAPKIKMLQRLDSVHLIPFFDVIIGDANKPNIESFELAMKLMDVGKSEVIMIGDWPERDFEGAKNTGIKFCFARYGSNFENQLDADYVADEFQDILKIVEKENESQ